jgi:hypothetical protein
VPYRVSVLPRYLLCHLFSVHQAARCGASRSAVLSLTHIRLNLLDYR